VVATHQLNATISMGTWQMMVRRAPALSSTERIEHKSAADGRFLGFSGALRSKKMREHAHYFRVFCGDSRVGG
jgi:hypothetical protein